MYATRYRAQLYVCCIGEQTWDKQGECLLLCCRAGLVCDVYADVAVLKLDGTGPQGFYNPRGIAMWLTEELPHLRTVYLKVRLWSSDRCATVNSMERCTLSVCVTDRSDRCPLNVAGPRERIATSPMQVREHGCTCVCVCLCVCVHRRTRVGQSSEVRSSGVGLWMHL